MLLRVAKLLYVNEWRHSYSPVQCMILRFRDLMLPKGQGCTKNSITDLLSTIDYSSDDWLVVDCAGSASVAVDLSRRQ